MNGKPFTATEDAFILANPMIGAHKLAKRFGRAYQSCRDRRLLLFDYRPPFIPYKERMA